MKNPSLRSLVLSFVPTVLIAIGSAVCIKTEAAPARTQLQCEVSGRTSSVVPKRGPDTQLKGTVTVNLFVENERLRGVVIQGPLDFSFSGSTLGDIPNYPIGHDQSNDVFYGIEVVGKTPEGAIQNIFTINRSSLKIDVSMTFVSDFGKVLTEYAGSCKILGKNKI